MLQKLENAIVEIPGDGQTIQIAANRAARIQLTREATERLGFESLFFVVINGEWLLGSLWGIPIWEIPGDSPIPRINIECHEPNRWQLFL